MRRIAPSRVRWPPDAKAAHLRRVGPKRNPSLRWSRLHRHAERSSPRSMRCVASCSTPSRRGLEAPAHAAPAAQRSRTRLDTRPTENHGSGRRNGFLGRTKKQTIFSTHLIVTATRHFIARGAVLRKLLPQRDSMVTEQQASPITTSKRWNLTVLGDAILTSQPQWLIGMVTGMRGEIAE